MKIVFFYIYTNFMIKKINVILLLRRCTYCVQNRTFQVEGYGIYVYFFKRRLLLFSCIATIAVKITAVLLLPSPSLSQLLSRFSIIVIMALCVFFAPFFCSFYTTFFLLHTHRKTHQPHVIWKIIKGTIRFDWNVANEYFNMFSCGKFIAVTNM